MSTTLNRVRPLRLAGLTLTNSPNNRGGKPITNRGGLTAAPAPAGGARPGALPGVHPQAAADRLLILANRRKAATGLPFDHCWNSARLENPRLFATCNVQLKREEFLLNRTPEFGDDATRQSWQIAEKIEETVRERLSKPVEIHRSGSYLGLWQEKWRNMQLLQSLTPDEAWLALKAADPQLFLDAMSETSDAKQYGRGGFQ